MRAHRHRLEGAIFSQGRQVCGDIARATTLVRRLRHYVNLERIEVQYRLHPPRCGIAGVLQPGDYARVSALEFLARYAAGTLSEPLATTDARRQRREEPRLRGAQARPDTSPAGADWSGGVRVGSRRMPGSWVVSLNARDGQMGNNGHHMS